MLIFMYPLLLYRWNRGVVNSDKMLNGHYMYTRHKGGSHKDAEWPESDEYPDFNQIKSHQSANWSALSLSHWVRYLPSKKYSIDHGVVGYRLADLYERFENEPMQPRPIFIHNPVKINYSHCEWVGAYTEGLSKAERRQIRMHFKHSAKVFVTPNQVVSIRAKVVSFCIMMSHMKSLLF